VELGFDSLLAVDLKSRVAAHLGVAVPVGEILLGSSIRDLAGAIAGQLVATTAPAFTSAVVSASAEEWEEGTI
jgi:hypothetical protein